MDAYERRMEENKRTQERNAARVHQMKLGAAVTVVKDSGDSVRSRVREAPWQTGSGQWLVAVDGIAGGYALERVHLELPASEA